MKSLASIVAESVLSDDAGMDANYTEILAATKTLYNVWVNKNDLTNKWGRTYSKYKVAKPTAIQVAKKMIKELQDAGAYDYKDFKQFLTRQKETKMTNPNGYNLVMSGSGIVLFNGTGKAERGIDEIAVYYMYNGKPHTYSAKFTDNGVEVICIKSYQGKPVIADARAGWVFEIPREIAEKIFDSNEISK